MYILEKDRYIKSLVSPEEEGILFPDSVWGSTTSKIIAAEDLETAKLYAAFICNSPLKVVLFNHTYKVALERITTLGYTYIFRSGIVFILFKQRKRLCFLYIPEYLGGFTGILDLVEGEKRLREAYDKTDED